MAIGAIIGLISSVVSIARALSPSEPAQTAQPQQAADKLFAKLDELGRGEIGSADLQSAFDRIRTDTAGSADRLFSKLDADSDGKITRSEFSGSINQLADQLDQHYMRLRLHGEDALPRPAADAGFTRDELAGQLSNLVSNFDRADANGDGRVSVKEAQTYARGNAADPAAAVRTAAADNRNVEMMLQVVRLMQAYGVVQGSTTTAGANNDGNNSAASGISVLG